MKTGIAVTTYFDKTSNLKRLAIIDACAKSLAASQPNCRVFWIDDGSPIRDHHERIKNYGMEIVVRDRNGGIARAKNSSLRVLLDAGCDLLFLADDDLIFHRGWDDAYALAMETMEMEHMAYLVQGMQYKAEAYRGVQIKRGLSQTTNGCFIAVTRSLIDAIGGFPILPYFYGHEHENFSMRALLSGRVPFYCDLLDAAKHIQLNPASHPCHSRAWNIQGRNQNLFCLKDPPIFERIEE
jgi:GT2 family glycosyltransferase